MIRAVLDANVFVSGVLRYGAATSTPAEILRRWLIGSFELVTSDALSREIDRTLLTNPYFAPRVDHAAGSRWLQSLATFAETIEIITPVSGVASHPEDDLVLATAVSASANYLVTGDKQLQRLGTFEGVSIVTPREFLSEID